MKFNKKKAMSEKTTISGGFISQALQEMNKNILTSAGPLDYNSLVWQDEKGEVNRHCTILNIENLL